MVNAYFARPRTVVDDGIWLCCRDVVVALDYSALTNVTVLFARVPEPWKRLIQLTTLGGDQKMLCVNEPGMWFFLSHSNKPKALPYQEWLIREVIPSIRKTDSYGTATPTPRTLSDMVQGCFAAVKCLRELYPNLNPDTASAAALTTIARTTGIKTDALIALLSTRGA